LGATGYLIDLVLAISTFLIGVIVPFFICFDYFSIAMLAAGDFGFLFSIFVASL
jgi:hypothetical protein